MDARTILSIMWRRWIVVLPIAILTLAAGVFVAGSPEVRYETYGSELLVSQRQTGEQASTVPSPAPKLVSIYIVDALRRPDFERELRESGFTTEFELIAEEGGSLITLKVTGDDQSEVLDTIEAILDRAPAAMASALGTELASSITLAPLTRPTEDQAVQLGDSYTLTVPLTVVSSSEAVSNPLPVGGATLRTLGEIASRRQLENSVEAVVSSGAFSVQADPRAAAPIISIEASADDPAGVLPVYEIVRADLARQLEVLQTAAGVESEDQTVLLQLVPPDTIEQTRGSTVRSAAGITLLGLGLAVLAAIVVDVSAQRRQSRRQRRRLSGDLDNRRAERASASASTGPNLSFGVDPPIDSASECEPHRQEISLASPVGSAFENERVRGGLPK